MLMALFLGKYLLNVLVSDVPGWTASFFFPGQTLLHLQVGMWCFGELWIKVCHTLRTRSSRKAGI